MVTSLWLVMLLSFVLMTYELNTIVQQTKQFLASGKRTASAGAAVGLFSISAVIFWGALYLLLQQPIWH